MYKNDITEFASNQIVEVAIKDFETGETKYERKRGDLSKWFKKGDIIEFDDSAESFLSLKSGDNILEGFKVVNLKVYRDSALINLKKESFHAVSMINKCLMSFFIYGS